MILMQADMERPLACVWLRLHSALIVDSVGVSPEPLQAARMFRNADLRHCSRRRKPGVSPFLDFSPFMQIKTRFSFNLCSFPGNLIDVLSAGGVAVFTAPLVPSDAASPLAQRWTTL